MSVSNKETYFSVPPHSSLNSFSNTVLLSNITTSNIDAMSLSWTSEPDSAAKASHRAQELFVEACGTLYNDILDAADLEQEVSEEVFVKRQLEMASQGAQLSEAVPQLTNMVSHKLSTVNRAMEHLKIRRRSPAEGCTREDREVSCLAQLRKWIHSTNENLGKIEAHFSRSAIARCKLDRLAADQQVLQLQIETEGQTLVHNAKRSVNREGEGCEVDSSEDQWDSRRQRHLKALTQRWHDLWLRSLSVQFRIEQQIDGVYQGEEDWESDPELREPVTKRRRRTSSERTITETSSDDPLRSEEDTIPFAEDEYERILDDTMLHTECGSVDERETFDKEDIEPQPDIGYSSGENSVHEALSEIAGVTTDMNSDCERRMRIESSPVKSFYRTVPLDDAGVTDTETPRICVPKWPMKFANDVLTDSLIVNTEDEQDIVTGNDMKEILSMLDDDENGNLQSEQFQEQIDVLKQGTQWREFKSGSGHRHSYKPPSHDNLAAVEDKNSCDASSEESDEPRGSSCNLSVSMNESQFNSLKRRHRGRSTVPVFDHSQFNSSLGALNKEMETSMMSTCSQPQSEMMCETMSTSFTLPPTASGVRHRRMMRRKLRARRLPRSMSDGEQMGNLMNASTYSAPPGSSMPPETTMRDTDASTTAPEHSDAPPYEWDDYNPPAKLEDGWGCEEQQDASVLTLEDDFQMYLGEDLRSLINESKATLRSAESLIGRQPSQQSLEDLRTLAKANSERLTATVVANPRIRLECLNDIDDVSKGWSSVLSTIETMSSPLSCGDSVHGEEEDSFSLDDSPLPAILSKIEKFASSLKLIQDDDNCSTSSLCSLSSIRSLDDVVNTLKVFTAIHDRLVEEREELRCLLDSSDLSGDLSTLVDDFEPLSMGYEDAIGRVEQLMHQIENVKEGWSDWSETQGNLQTVMCGIEKELAELRKGSDNSKQICTELEMCQERMNRLETVCNYLTSNLAVLNDSSSALPALDFASELAVYSNALGQLKSRFEETVRSSDKIDKSTSVNNVRKRRQPLTVESSTNTIRERTHRGISWTLQAVVLLAVMSALTAWLVTTDNVLVSSLRRAFGPRLDYIDGPPPM